MRAWPLNARGWGIVIVVFRQDGVVQEDELRRSDEPREVAVEVVEKVKLGMSGRWDDETRLKLVAFQRNRKVVF